jgi:hypothetical protein
MRILKKVQIVKTFIARFFHHIYIIQGTDIVHITMFIYTFIMGKGNY